MSAMLRFCLFALSSFKNCLFGHSQFCFILATWFFFYSSVPMHLFLGPLAYLTFPGVHSLRTLCSFTHFGPPFPTFLFFSPCFFLSQEGLPVRIDPIARRALRMWVSLYGAEAGNFALKTMAYGGVYIAGGIAVKVRKMRKRRINKQRKETRR